MGRSKLSFNPTITGWRPFITAVICTIALAAGSLAPAFASSAPNKEYLVKAAYLYNFLKFIRWPDGTEQVNLCIYGDNPFGSFLDKIAQKAESNGITFNIHSNIEKTRHGQCTILYIADSHATQVATILSSLDQKPILTVSDIPGFADKGGMIGFTMREQKVRIEVNLTATEKSTLMVNPELLEVADRVIGQHMGGGL